jgi:1-acyl-sn-glycerol-3-phosphate acyltransferase
MERVIGQQRRPAGASRGDEGLSELSEGMFRLRKGLIDQFSRVEREIARRKVKPVSGLDADDVDQIMLRMGLLRDELDSALLRLEEQVHLSAERVLRAVQNQKPRSHFQGYITERLGIDDGIAEEFFQGLTPFNLRRKYSELSLRLRSEEVDPFGFDPVFESFVRPVMDFLYTTYWRVETYGMSHIPREGPALLVGNHSGSLPYDAGMLKFAVQREHPSPRQLRFMVEDFLFHFPFLGALMNRYGGVRASQENAESLLARQLPVVVFPEGVKGLGKLYRDKYHLARFGRGGFVRLCLRTRAPLIPVAFIGPEEIHPMIFRETKLASLLGLPYIPVTPTFPLLGPLGLIPLPSKWSIYILPAVDFSSYGPGAENDRVLVYKMSRMVKEQIQDTIVDKLKQRRSIWFG